MVQGLMRVVLAATFVFGFVSSAIAQQGAVVATAPQPNAASRLGFQVMSCDAFVRSATRVRNDRPVKTKMKITNPPWRRASRESNRRGAAAGVFNGSRWCWKFFAASANRPPKTTPLHRRGIHGPPSLCRAHQT